MKLTLVKGEKVDAWTSLRLLQKLERAYPDSRVIHVYLDNARYHHAKILRLFLERPDCCIRLRFPPPYAPHLNPIERLWGTVHRYVTHNRFHSDFRQFTAAIFAFFNATLPGSGSQSRTPSPTISGSSHMTTTGLLGRGSIFTFFPWILLP